MATNKKDTNPHLIFRKEWWDFMRWESNETVGKAMKVLCEHYFGYTPFDVDRFSEANPPQLHERLAIPMIKTADTDKQEYAQRCEKNSANAKSRFATNTTEPDEMRTQANASERIQSQANGGLREEKVREDNYFFCAPAHTCEETSPEKKEKKETLLSLTFFFISKAVLKPYTTAEAAWNYNEAQDWKCKSRNGNEKDYSKNKLAFLKGWQCEGDNYSHEDAEFFIAFCKHLGLYKTEVLDDFHGLQFERGLKFLFNRKNTVDWFLGFFRANEPALKQANAFIEKKYPNSEGIGAGVYKKD